MNEQYLTYAFTPTINSDIRIFFDTKQMESDNVTHAGQTLVQLSFIRFCLVCSVSRLFATNIHETQTLALLIQWKTAKNSSSNLHVKMQSLLTTNAFCVECWYYLYSQPNRTKKIKIVSSLLLRFYSLCLFRLAKIISAK